MYKIELSNQAAKSYLKLPTDVRKKVDRKLQMLTKDPHARNNNIKPLKGMNHCYRLRVGDWRIIYELINKQLKIYVIKVAQRKEVYNK